MIQDIALKMFDIRKLRYRCNYPNCNRKPKKEIVIYEYATKKGLMKLYLCNKHSDISELMERIKGVTPKIIEKSIKDMGQ